MDLVSSHLRAVEFDEATQTLAITFVNGDTYQYPKVPKAVYQQLMAAPSKGQAFHQLIRNRFTGQKVEG